MRCWTLGRVCLLFFLKQKTAYEMRISDWSSDVCFSDLLIDEKIAKLGGWRGDTLAHLRALIREAEPGVTETIKWRKPSNPLGVPVWEHGGILCTAETYKDKVKLTFARGASLADPARLFNARPHGGPRRALDLFEGDGIDTEAFKALVPGAVAPNEHGNARG